MSWSLFGLFISLDYCFFQCFSTDDKLQFRVLKSANKFNKPNHHHHHHDRVAGEGRRVVAPPCPWSTARLQSSPVGRVESFRSWSSHLFRARPGGLRHVQSGGRLSDTLTWS